MAGSTITVSVGQFAQQLRQKYPQYGLVPDDKLIAAFLSKNPKYTGNYEGVTLVSVSFEPAAADAAAEKPDETIFSHSISAGYISRDALLGKHRHRECAGSARSADDWQVRDHRGTGPGWHGPGLQGFRYWHRQEPLR